MIRFAINGFGRIGRNTYRAIIERGLDKELELVAVNDLTDATTLAHLLKYDSVLRKFPGSVEEREGALVVNEKKIQVIAEKDPEKLPWKKLKIDVVLECTGRYTKDGAARAHLKAGAKRVIISAPAKGGDVKTFVLGVNQRAYQGEHVNSHASGTPNGVSPVTRVVNDAFGIEKAALTTIHAVTAEQNLV
ncbi:MAG: glyceraldehyde 3-phosphate dehydrogenase NAD-binding domain-containing protein, partial [bacterium]|nr:glyceraldehyde 3-phosphate dehydrogenase NAD-binding domain-containing protein [bacterium]